MLCTAVRYDSLEIIKIILDEGAKFNDYGYARKDDKYFGVYRDCTEILIGTSYETENGIKKSAGTPLHWACVRFNFDRDSSEPKLIVQELVKRGANLKIGLPEEPERTPFILSGGCTFAFGGMSTMEKISYMELQLIQDCLKPK